jgi:phospholipase/carboxylesterase
MNRLASPHAPYSSHTSSSSLNDASAFLTPASHSTAKLRRGVARPTCKAGPGIALFAPIHYERRYAYPLLIWLHGEGSNECELRQLMPNVSVRNYVGAAARGVPADREPMGRFAWPQSVEAVEAAADRVAECIEQATNRYHVHPGRVFLAGQGTGGTMALRLALQYGLPLAGALSLGGALPRGRSPMARVKQARKLPLMLMTCRDSQIYPPRQVAEDLRLLHAAGCQLAVREYLCGDELFTDMFADMDHWMMEKVCQPKSAARA